MSPAIDKPRPTVREVFTITDDVPRTFRWYRCRFCGARYMWNWEHASSRSLRAAPAKIRLAVYRHARDHGTQPGPIRSMIVPA